MSETPTETPAESPAEPTPAPTEEAPEPEAAGETSDAAAATSGAPAEEVVEVEEEVLEEVVEEVVVEVGPGTEGGDESSPAPPPPTEETTQPESGDAGDPAPVSGAPAEEVVEIEEEVLEEVVEEEVDVEPGTEGGVESSLAHPADNDGGEPDSNVGNSIEAPGSEDEAGDDDGDAETGDLASADHGDTVSEFKDEDAPDDSPQAASVEEDIELGNGVGGDVVEATANGIMKPHKVGLHGQALEDQRRIKGLSVMCACVCIAVLAVGLPLFIPFALDLPTIIEED